MKVYIFWDTTKMPYTLSASFLKCKCMLTVTLFVWI